MNKTANRQFPVYGVQHEFLGYAHADSEDCGERVWPQARALGAKAYSVAEAAITPVGVMLENRDLLGLEASSKMPIPQVLACVELLGLGM